MAAVFANIWINIAEKTYSSIDEENSNQVISLLVMSVSRKHNKLINII